MSVFSLWRSVPLPHKLCSTFLMTMAFAIPVHAENIYPLLHVDRSTLVEPPTAIVHFQATLRHLQNDGALEAGSGMSPRPNLDGMAAKPWLLHHVAPDFSCLRDFGGTCRADVSAQMRFLDMFSDHPHQNEPMDILPDLRIEATEIATGHAMYSKVEDMFCSPHAIFSGRDMIEAALIAWSGDDLLLILDRLRAVIGSYNYRSAPQISAPILATLRDAVLYMPDPWTVTEESDASSSYRWHEVMLPDGRRAYVAPAAGDLLDAGGLSSRICFDLKDGTARIRAHIGGGD
ncbi:hypothetical protein G5B38_03045 [Pseudohalocynthiibacter aestuariivivens]|nr:hypothetical protein [Pseudohalocynthiibacter aestuariivivens]QIE44588.1 hypothetical protein G5B38_03045 [Pseudohalocynthiibacter aestuariivivens]